MRNHGPNEIRKGMSNFGYGINPIGMIGRTSPNKRTNGDNQASFVEASDAKI